MDIATFVGLLLALALIVGSISMGSAPMTAFFDVKSLLVVVGGSTAACLMSFPLKTILNLPRILTKVFWNRQDNVADIIDQIVSLAETARKDGLLALESRVEVVGHSFIRLGVQMAVDGSRPEVIEDVLRTEMNAISARHKDGKSVLDQAGKFAPAYGMIGTLMGLIMMLSNMSDPSGIGAGMAVALITTLYGALAANVVFQPWAQKLGFIDKAELACLEVIVRGIIAIQMGENPRVIRQKLSTFLPRGIRVQRERAA